MEDKRLQNNDECEAELGFLAAMHAYRAAKDSGDKEAMRQAEDAWRERVRAELTGSDACETQQQGAPNA